MANTNSVAQTSKDTAQVDVRPRLQKHSALDSQGLNLDEICALFYWRFLIHVCIFISRFSSRHFDRSVSALSQRVLCTDRLALFNRNNPRMGI